MRTAQPARHGRPRRTKYGAVRTTVDNIVFASKKEAKRYSELKLLEKAQVITQLFLQPRFDLYVHGVKIGSYVADFGYFSCKGATIIEDVKGMKTPLYRWKKKHVEAQYGIQIREV